MEALHAWEDSLVEFFRSHSRERPLQLAAGGLLGLSALKLLAEAPYRRDPRLGDLVDSHSADPHVRDNEFVLGAHRRGQVGLLPSLASCFRLHNETGNIWTHAVMTAYLVYLAARERRWQRSQGQRDLTFVLMLLGFSGVTATSTVAHVFNHESERLSRILFGADRAGIAVMLATVTLCSAQIHFADALPRRLFSALTVATAVVTAKAVYRGQDPQLQATSFGVQTLLGLIPLSREFLAAPGDARVRQLMLDAVAVYGLSGAGGLFYGLKVPERFAPGRFDLVPGHSIMHVLVSFAMLLAYSGSKRWASWKGHYTRAAHL